MSRESYQEVLDHKVIFWHISAFKMEFCMKKWISFSITLAFFICIIPICLKGEEAMPSELIDIQTFIPSLQVDLKYATSDNFTGEIVYDFNCCLLVKEAALRLREVQAELESIGLGLKVWDGFRPMAAQWKFWELVPDERYVSDPRKGGRHTRGTAVDLTLVTSDGEELLMPSGFDDFSEKAHQDYMGATEEAIRNRGFLRKIMEKHGFSGLGTEWWHFDLVGWQKYPPLDINPDCSLSK